MADQSPAEASALQRLERIEKALAGLAAEGEKAAGALEAFGSDSAKMRENLEYQRQAILRRHPSLAGGGGGAATPAFLYESGPAPPPPPPPDVVAENDRRRRERALAAVESRRAEAAARAAQVAGAPPPPAAPPPGPTFPAFEHAGPAPRQPTIEEMRAERLQAEAAQKLKDAADALQRGERERKSGGDVGARAQIGGALYGLVGASLGGMRQGFNALQGAASTADPFSAGPTLAASMKGLTIELQSGLLPAIRDLINILQTGERLGEKVPGPVKTAAGDQTVFGLPLALMGGPALAAMITGVRALFGGGKQPELQDFHGPSARIFNDPAAALDAIQVASLNTGDKTAENLRKQLENAQKMQQTVENIAAQIDRLIGNTAPRHR